MKVRVECPVCGEEREITYQKAKVRKPSPCRSCAARLRQQRVRMEDDIRGIMRDVERKGRLTNELVKYLGKFTVTELYFLNGASAALLEYKMLQVKHSVSHKAASLPEVLPDNCVKFPKPKKEV